METIGAVKNKWACTFHLKKKIKAKKKLKLTAPMEIYRKIRLIKKKWLEKRLLDEEVMPF